MNKRFEFLEHTADVKFQAFGRSIENCFENSALALKEVICGKTKIRDNKNIKISLKARDYEALLYRFLEEILYRLEAEEFIISKVKEIKIKNFALTAIINGDKVQKYNFTNPVKAVTYNDMFVKNLGTDKGWIAQVVLDI